MTPFKGINRVTSVMGPRTSPITGAAETHAGQDIVTSGTYPGSAWEVRECTGGTVAQVTSDKWRGNYVDVRTSANTIERYQHMQSIYVKAGQAVPQGTVLGMAGKTGDSTGVHLHFEVQVNGKAVNPAQWSDVPNKVGSYAGNDNIDGQTSTPAPSAKLQYVRVGPATAGDIATIRNLVTPRANELGLPVDIIDA